MTRAHLLQLQALRAQVIALVQTLDAIITAELDTDDGQDLTFAVMGQDDE